MEHCGDNNDDNDDMSMEDIEDEEEEEDEEEMEDDGIPEEDAALARRQTILAVMRDRSLSETERNGRIQAIMTGNRQVVVEEQAPEDGVAGLPDPAVATTTTTTACVHYERNCSVVAPCCGKIVGCRICHDELSPQGHPPMNRFLIREVVCKNCNVRQPCSNECINCKTVFGEYHCNVCNLWMSLSKKPFHCDQCGLCRVGGIESFRHCNECSMCISVAAFESHQCFRDKYKNNCPVCCEDMFSSRQSPQDLPCGHAIHALCFRKLAGFDYRCPLCKKTVVSPQSMAAAWEARAREVAEHPMAEEFQRIVNIMCIDCESKSNNRQWHFLGIQCPCCNSFNTVVEQVVSVGTQGNQGNRNTSSGAA